MFIEDQDMFVEQLFFPPLKSWMKNKLYKSYKKKLENMTLTWPIIFLGSDIAVQDLYI